MVRTRIRITLMDRMDPAARRSSRMYPEPNYDFAGHQGVSAGNDAAGTATNQGQVGSNLPRPGNYVGAPANPPLSGGNVASVSNVGLTTALSSPSALNQLVQTLEQNADAVLPNPPPAPGVDNSGTTYPYGGTGWPSGMSATRPQVVVVDRRLRSGSQHGIWSPRGNGQLPVPRQFRMEWNYSRHRRRHNNLPG